MVKAARAALLWLALACGAAPAESPATPAARIDAALATARAWLETEHVAGHPFDDTNPQFAVTDAGRTLVHVSVQADVDRNVYVYRLRRSMPGNGGDAGLIDSFEAATPYFQATPRFSSDGALLYLKPGGHGNALVVLGPGGAREHVFTVAEQWAGRVAAGRGFRWSPDGRAIAFIATPPATAEPAMRAIDTSTDWSPWSGDAPVVRSRLALIDRADGALRFLTPDTVDVLAFDWSPDGERLVISAVMHGPDAARSGRDGDADLFLVARGGGALRDAVREAGADTGPRWSPDGRTIAFRHASSSARRVTDIMLLDPGSGDISRLDAAEARGARQIGWVGASTLAFNRIEELSTTAYVYDVSGADAGTLRRVPFGTPSMFGRAVPGDAASFFLTYQNVTAPPNVVRVDLATLSLSPVTAYASGAASTLAASPYAWTNPRTGDRIPGLLLHARNQEQVGKWPLFVYLEGGPNPIIGVWGGTPAMPLFAYARLGATVFVPSSRGRGGVSEAFSRYYFDTFDRAAGPLADIESGIDALDREGRVDRCRIAIGGQSYGGYLTAWAVAHSRTFAGAHVLEGVSMAEPFDRLRMVANDRLSELVPGLPRAYSFDGTRLFERDSPLTAIQRVRTPVQLEYGMQAYGGADHHDGVLLFQALSHFEVPTRFLRYPRTGHGITEPALRMDSARANLEWFAYWTLGLGVPGFRQRFGPRDWVPEGCATR